MSNEDLCYLSATEALKLFKSRKLSPRELMAALIEAFVALDDAEAGLLRSLSEVTLRNWNGIKVGGLRASQQLRDKAPTLSL